MKLKKLLSLVLVLALVLAYAPVNNAKAWVSDAVNASTKELTKKPATLVSDTNPVSTTGETCDGLVEGRTVKWDHQLYTLEGKITKVTSSDISVEYIFTVKVDACKALGYDDAWCSGYAGYVNFNGGSNHVVADEEQSASYSIIKSTATISKKEMNVGANGFIFSPEITFKDDAGGTSATIDKTVMDVIISGKTSEHKVSDYDFYIYKTSLILGKAFSSDSADVTEAGTVVAYRPAGGEWKEATFTSGQSLNITGLTPNTKYEYKTKDYVKGTNSSGGYTLDTGFSSVNSVNTAGTAPKVKSIKKVKVKQYKVTIPGQFVNHKWIATHKEWRTSYTVKVTLSSVPKNVYKIVIDNLGDNSAPTYVKTAKTFKATFVEKGKTKGKKSKLYVYTVASSEKFVGASDNKGKSDVTTKTVKH